MFEIHTVEFITSAIWEVEEEKLEVSGVAVPESRVIPCEPLAFALLSDGCEKHSFECSHFDENEEKWSDPNTPYPKFFNPLVTNLRAAAESDTPQGLIEKKWASFLQSSFSKWLSPTPRRSLRASLSRGPSRTPYLRTFGAN